MQVANDAASQLRCRKAAGRRAPRGLRRVKTLQAPCRNWVAVLSSCWCCFTSSIDRHLAQDTRSRPRRNQLYVQIRYTVRLHNRYQFISNRSEA